MQLPLNWGRDFAICASKQLPYDAESDATAARKVTKSRRVKGQEYAVNVRPRQSGKLEEANRLTRERITSLRNYHEIARHPKETQREAGWLN